MEDILEEGEEGEGRPEVSLSTQELAALGLGV